MQQFCTYGSVRGAPGQPTSLPRQNLKNGRLLSSNSLIMHTYRVIALSPRGYKNPFCCGRDRRVTRAPKLTQIRTGKITAYGLTLGYLASKRRFGTRVKDFGTRNPANRPTENRSHVIRSRWLRRRSARYQRQMT